MLYDRLLYKHIARVPRKLALLQLSQYNCTQIGGLPNEAC